MLYSNIVTGQASPNSLRNAELVSVSHDLAILKQVQDDDSTIVEPDLLPNIYPTIGLYPFIELCLINSE